MAEGFNNTIVFHKKRSPAEKTTGRKCIDLWQYIFVCSNAPKKYIMPNIFSHPDYTVGIGITPIQPYFHTGR